jgi:hypothetical protein
MAEENAITAASANLNNHIQVNLKELRLILSNPTKFISIFFGDLAKDTMSAKFMFD